METTTTSTRSFREWDAIHYTDVHYGIVTRVFRFNSYTEFRIVGFRKSKRPFINDLKILWIRVVDCFSW